MRAGLGAAALLGVAAASLSGSKFRFKLDQLYEVNVGLESLRGTPAAFGSFSSDQRTDLVVITPDQKGIELWEWQPGGKSFAHKPSADIRVDGGMLISNVIPGDYNMDGHLDLLVQGAAKSAEEITMRLYLGDGGTAFTDAGELPSAADALPFAFDHDGTGRVALLGVPWDQRSAPSAPPAWVWASTVGGSKDSAPPATTPADGSGGSNASAAGRRRDASALFSLQPLALPANGTAMCRPASPHSSAFVDLDGDCLADLFIVCAGNEEYQIWTNGPGGFVYSQTGKLPSGAGPVSFADMNADGSMDMVIPIPEKSQVYVVYNQQRPLCVGVRKQAGCRNYDRLCEGDPGFRFSLPDAQVIDISAMWHGEVLRGALDGFEGQSAPPYVKLGDLNLDGFPDMAVVTQRGSGQARVRLLRSEPCDSCTVGGDKLLSRRQFAAVTDGVAALEQFKNVQDVALFDLDGTGTLDLLVHYRDGSGARRASAVYNNFFTDAFFIKATVCPTSVDGDTRLYTGYYAGPSFKYLLVSDAGRKHVAQAAQVPQTAHRALYTPYTVIGIGRTNNYIEDFSVGSTGALGRQQRSFEGLIPNSQVVVFPRNTTADWRLELYMNRSESTPYILATLLAAMVALAITVVALGALERKADRREKQRALHSINFDAL
ncbi:hypothetical protein H4R21_000328 [Coemansia helicoidea]|uniref:Uncharacterized protein n=1 Tax=Coemansia helicoidea TaxID=1286919 RepID=A0ACC1LHR3_9FUNG|nr:hypothetical protein H4R21_000328 [Coemansia helicoidea]